MILTLLIKGAVPELETEAVCLKIPEVCSPPGTVIVYPSPLNVSFGPSSIYERDDPSVRLESDPFDDQMTGPVSDHTPVPGLYVKFSTSSKLFESILDVSTWFHAEMFVLN